MYNILDTKKTTELSLVKHGFFNPEYELTDGAYSYGKLTCPLLSAGKATAETATVTWTFKREQLFNRTILITDENGTLVGKATRELFTRATTLSLQTGFTAKFYRPSIWARPYVWESEGYGEIMHIRPAVFSFTSTVYIDQSMAPVSVIPLLIFFGSYLSILRRRQKAAH